METVDQELKGLCQAMQGMQSDFVDQVTNPLTRTFTYSTLKAVHCSNLARFLLACASTEHGLTRKCHVWVCLLTGILQMRKVNENLELIFEKIGAQP